MIFDLIKHAKQLLFDDSNANTGSNNVQGAIDKNSSDISQNSTDLYVVKNILKKLAVADNPAPAKWTQGNGENISNTIHTATEDCIVELYGFIVFPSYTGAYNKQVALTANGKFLMVESKQSSAQSYFPMRYCCALKKDQSLVMSAVHWAGVDLEINMTLGKNVIPIDHL
jgi:hypothetical protein